MKAECYIITITTNKESVLAAERCISTSNKFELPINLWNAYTPRHNPLKLLKDRGVNINGFKDIENFSHGDAAAGCFLSHFTLWEKCIELNKPIIILEHDAVIINKIPSFILDGTGFEKLVNIGTPGHDEYTVPKFTGVGLLYSSWRGSFGENCTQFKGTHAYAIKPAGAMAVIAQAKKSTTAADMFFNSINFPFLEELYPWPVTVEPRFTTIQRGTSLSGCGLPRATSKYGPFTRLDEFGKARE